jgi:hypothetical protein
MDFESFLKKWLATSGENPKSPAQVEEEYQHSTINYVGL